MGAIPTRLRLLQVPRPQRRVEPEAVVRDPDAVGDTVPIAQRLHRRRKNRMRLRERWCRRNVRLRDTRELRNLGRHGTCRVDVGRVSRERLVRHP